MKKTHITLLLVFSLFFNLLAVSPALAVKPIYSGGKERAAIRGYDPVAYLLRTRQSKAPKSTLQNTKALPGFLLVMPTNKCF